MKVGDLVTHYRKCAGQVGLVIDIKRHPIFLSQIDRCTVWWPEGRSGWPHTDGMIRFEDHKYENLRIWEGIDIWRQHESR